MDGCVSMMLDDVPFIVHVINDSLGDTFRVFCALFYGGNSVYLQLVHYVSPLFRMSRAPPWVVCKYVEMNYKLYKNVAGLLK